MIGYCQSQGMTPSGGRVQPPEGNNKLKATFHRNLSATGGNAWSFVANGKATQAATIYAEGVTVKQPSGKKFDACLAGGKRGVFAWFKSNDVRPNENPPMPDNAVRIRFNPKNGDKFFHANGGRVDAIGAVWCLENGECWGVI